MRYTLSAGARRLLVTAFRDSGGTAIEVVCGTALLGWAMLSLPSVMGKTMGPLSRRELTAVLSSGAIRDPASKQQIVDYLNRTPASVTVSREPSQGYLPP